MLGIKTNNYSGKSRSLEYNQSKINRWTLQTRYLTESGHER